MYITSKKIVRTILNIWSLAGIVLLLVTAIVYLKWNGFGEQGEVNFATVSWLLYQGYPLYTDIDFPARYSLQHGPIVYLFAGAIMKLFGPGYITAKLSGIITLFAVIGFSWMWFSKLLAKRDAFLLLGLEIWLLFHWHHAYFIRPDSMMMLCIIVSMYIMTTKKNQTWLLLGTFIPLAVMVNLKIHGVLYFLPILVMAYQRLGLRKVVYGSVITLLLAIVPFLLPQISFQNYFLWLSQSLQHGFTIRNFIPKIAIIAEVFILISAIGAIYGVSLWNLYLRNKAMMLSLCCSLLVISIIASKGGSGTNHIMPFVPMFCYLIILLLSEQTSGEKSPSTLDKPALLAKVSYVMIALLLTSITVSAINTEKRFFTIITANTRRGIVRDVHSIERSYAGKTLAIGYGEAGSHTVYRDLIPLPVFAGNPLLIEIVALEDMKAAGLAIPAATIQSLEQGAIQVWLIPVGESPFAMKNAAQSQIFDEPFREAFLKNYTLTSSTNFFDIWVYRGASKI